MYPQSGYPGMNPQGQNPQQYGQQQQQFPMQPMATGMPMMTGMAPQQTGFPGVQPFSGIGSQPTGYNPLQQQQHQQQQQQQPSNLQPPQQNYGMNQLGYQQTSLQPHTTGFPQQQPAQTGFGGSASGFSQTSSAPTITQQKTGMTSSQVADSFRTKSSSSPSMPRSGNAIPNIRLSFISAQDQTKFEDLFRSSVGSNKSMTGDEAKEILLRSGLAGNTLADIWTLSDTTKAGHLLFPEFALAMYLCHQKLSGRDIPRTLPEKIKNEVSSVVDIISFGVPEEPSSNIQQSIPVIKHPQPISSVSNSQLLGQLSSQPTGLNATNSLFPQQTSAGISSQPTGAYGQDFSSPLNPIAPMQTGVPPTSMHAPLNAQPTGRPGQWGLVNAPTSGLPNIQTLMQRLMPQAAPNGLSGNYTTAGLVGNADIPWAVTKEEKKIYDDLYRAWGGFRQGYIKGSQAIEIFTKSGLEKRDLEHIWTLADQNDRGRLNLDEFAVAMHLVYRKLNGFDIPNRLPAELVPPSIRNLNDSIGSMKSMLARDAEERKNTGQFLQPQGTGYQKSHTFQTSPTSFGRKDATSFKNNDDNVGYRSSARRRPAAFGSEKSPSLTEDDDRELSVAQLRKLIREKKVLLEAIDVEDEREAEQERDLDRRDRRTIDDLYQRIRSVQVKLDEHPNSHLRDGGDNGAEKRALSQQLQGLVDKLPRLASDVRKVEEAIAEAQLELFRIRDAKEHPESGIPIRGTGPGGAVTEQDRRLARARAMMKQRTAALLNQPADPDDEDGSEAAIARAEQERAVIDTEKKKNVNMVSGIEDGVSAFSRVISDALEGSSTTASSTEHERRRWEDGLGVEDEVRDFIFELQRESKSRSSRKAPARASAASSSRYEHTERSDYSSSRSLGSHAPSPRATAAASTQPLSNPDSGAGYSNFKTAEERAAYIKEQATKRMAERLAALGIKPAGSGSSAESAKEKQQKEEEENRRREEERQQRLQSERITPPAPTGSRGTGKPPPPPPARKEAKRPPPPVPQSKAPKPKETPEPRDDYSAERSAESDRLRALEEQVQQREIEKKRRAEEKKRRKEEQAQAEAQAKAKAKAEQERQAARQAEREAAERREQELQRRLQQLQNETDSSDLSESEPEPEPVQESKAPQAIPAPPKEPSPEPVDESVKSQSSDNYSALSSSMVYVNAPGSGSAGESTPVTINLPNSGNSIESKNPFLRLPGAAATVDAAQPVSVPVTEVSTNPFHGMTGAPQPLSTAPLNRPPPVASAQPEEKATTPASAATPRRAAEEDDWSIVSSQDDSDSDDSDEGRPGNAKELAAILFRTMGGPSRTQTPGGDIPASPQVNHESLPGAAVASPAVPPPPPPMGAPAAATAESSAETTPHAVPATPAVAPAPPAVGAPAVGAPPAMGALLGAIQGGAKLRKAVTNDRSAANAGRLLG